VTRDGGRTWTTLDVTPDVICPGPPCPANLVGPPSFFSSQSGVSVVTFTNPIDSSCPSASPAASPSDGCQITVYQPVARTLSTTADGGITWSSGQTLPALEGNLIAFDSKRWIDVEATGLESTNDGGRAWSKRGPIRLPAGWYLSQAEFLSSDTGVIVISNARYAATMASAGSFSLQGTELRFAMLATSDGGRTWKRIALPAA
jgi:hypothetical protein